VDQWIKNKFWLSLGLLMTMSGARGAESPPPPAKPASVESPCVARAQAGPVSYPVILGYHDIVPATSPASASSDISLGTLRAEIEALRAAGYRFVALADFYASLLNPTKSLPERAVILTFDDGYAGQFLAYEYLKEQRIPATFFVVTASIGVKATKDHLSWAQLQEIHANPLFSVGSHTVTHANLKRTSDPARVTRELVESQRILQAQGLVNEQGNGAWLAYPEGAYTVEAARVAGENYDLAFGYTSQPVYANTRGYKVPLLREADPCMQIPRFPVGRRFEQPETLLGELRSFRMQLRAFGRFTTEFAHPGPLAERSGDGRQFP
jgi:peptidoglycan/xylan/chitin deacetylase (PgdA/CDA1 family)